MVADELPDFVKNVCIKNDHRRLPMSAMSWCERIYMEINKNWQRALLTPEVTLQQAINNLNETGLQIIMVISHDGKLQGTVTDGDIRRGLLRGCDLDSQITSLINQHAFVVPPEMSREGILHLMKANRIRQIPIIDRERRVVGLHLLEEFSNSNNLSNRMVIMAGGLGTRLRPHTENCPKPLLPIAGKPILEHILERASTQGFANFTISVYYLGQMIVDYFGDGGRWDVQIDYLREQFPMGTAGALRLFNSPDKPFLVLNGDILTSVRYAELLDFHRRYNATATMAVRRYEWQHPFGVVQTEGVDIVGFQEKPVTSTYVNAGIYVLEPSALSFLQEEEIFCDMPVLFDRIRQDGLRTVVYPIHEEWLDVGLPESLAMANKDMVDRENEKKYERIIQSI